MIRQLKSKTFKKYLNNTSWLLGEKMLRMLLNLLVTALLARYLGPSSFGKLNYAQSFVAIFAVFANLGLDQIVTRDIVRGEGRIDALLGTCFLLKFVSGLAVAVIVFFSALFFEKNVDEFILTSIISLNVILQSSSTFVIYFQAIVKSKSIAVAQSIGMFLASVLKVVLLLYDFQLFWFAIALVVEQILIFSLLIYVFVNNGRSPLSWRFDKELAVSLMRDSWPLIFSSVIIVIYAKIDQVMINYMLDATAVGSYAVAVRLSEATGFITLILTTSLFPAVIKAKEKSESEYNKVMQSVLDVIVLVNIVIALVTIMISKPLISVLFGSGYEGSSQVLNIHVWGTLFAGLGLGCTKWLILEGLQKLRIYRTLLGVVVNIILNVMLIPKFGITGAAFSTLISQMIASYFGNLLKVETRKIFVMQTKALFLFRKIKFSF